MKDTSKKIVCILLVIYLITTIVQVFFSINSPITGRASTAQISLIILSRPPSFPLIPNQTVYVGDIYVYYVKATDSDNDNLTFTDNATFFNITEYNITTGLINFIATTGMIGIHHVNISVTDGYNNLSQNVVFTISEPPPPSSAGGGAVTPGMCIPAWVCSSWEPCTKAGIQYRSCVDVKNCDVLRGKPPENRICLYIPTCFDGIQNGKETDTDCGGQFCKPCEDNRKCKLDRDCMNECNAETGLCYSLVPPTIPPLEIMPAPVSLWKRLKSIAWTAIKYLVSKYIIVIPIILVLILFVCLVISSKIKEKLRLIYIRGDQSVWRYKKYILKIFRIKNRKKLRVDLEIATKRKRIYKTVVLSNILDTFKYALKSMRRGFNPVVMDILLFELKKKLKRKYD